MKCQCKRADGSNCRGKASYRIESVFQTTRHAKVGTGWFWIYLCRMHFSRTEFSAKTNLRGRRTWKEITPV